MRDKFLLLILAISLHLSSEDVFMDHTTTIGNGQMYNRMMLHHQPNAQNPPPPYPQQPIPSPLLTDTKQKLLSELLRHYLRGCQNTDIIRGDTLNYMGRSARNGKAQNPNFFNGLNLHLDLRLAMELDVLPSLIFAHLSSNLAYSVEGRILGTALKLVKCQRRYFLTDLCEITVSRTTIVNLSAAN
jgi:hypothetical protein